MKDILKILEDNAHTPHDRIATMTGRSVEEVKRVIQDAETNRTIVKYKTMVDWEKQGEQQAWALIEVKIIPERDVGFDSIAERIFRFPETRSVYLVSGGYDLAVIVVADDIYQVSQFVSNKLATIDAVHGTVTHFLLKRYKEDGEILVEHEESKRQPMVP
ncbi:Lrp/AsnC family transcriptional regulator [Dehalococcoidia bacterium]|nr:Lrp/AsnC family transcriptional regulator [Dehalococcoidia bacterium]